jgi:DNA-binding transcriptional LysR family regulator
MGTPDLFDLKLLQLFDVLYDCRSVTRAAEQLGLSQPMASISLGKLRERLGDALFVRTGAGMAPTPRADALVGPCREILESMRRFGALERGFSPLATQRRFRICMTDASHVTLLPRLLAHVRAQAPGVRLEAARIDEHTERVLETGEADLAIGHVPWLGPAIYQQQLYEQDWVCLANAHHPRIRKRLSQRQYRDEGHVLTAAGTGAQLLQQALARERIERRVVLELPGFLGLGPIVQTTDLIATLPRHIGSTLAQAHGLAVHACPFAVDRFAVRQHWHPRYHQEPGLCWLRGVVQQLFGPAVPDRRMSVI